MLTLFYFKVYSRIFLPLCHAYNNLLWHFRSVSDQVSHQKSIGGGQTSQRSVSDQKPNKKNASDQKPQPIKFRESLLELGID